MALKCGETMSFDPSARPTGARQNSANKPLPLGTQLGT
uniref:Uncharacterized protein n=2 Tax=Anguilla anguilla TaxID=7936 RepID=A0A0E9SHH3_ANGAN